jgi:hypothetical protein
MLISLPVVPMNKQHLPPLLCPATRHAIIFLVRHLSLLEPSKRMISFKSWNLRFFSLIVILFEPNLRLMDGRCGYEQKSDDGGFFESPRDGGFKLAGRIICQTVFAHNSAELSIHSKVSIE